MAENKRVTLHPLKSDGSIDESINLYPKTLIDGVVDYDGNEVVVQEKLESGENIKTINNKDILGEGNVVINPILMQKPRTPVTQQSPSILKKFGLDFEHSNFRTSRIYHFDEVGYPEHIENYYKQDTSNNTPIYMDNFAEYFVPVGPESPQLDQFVSYDDGEYTYTFFAVDDSGMRIGTSNNIGWVDLVCNKEVTIYVRKYFSYNPQEGTSSYDEASRVKVDDTYYDFGYDDSPISITLTPGTHRISSNIEEKEEEQENPETGETILTTVKVPGRIFIENFEILLPERTWHESHTLANSEDVDNAIEDLQESEIDPIKSDITSIQNTVSNVIDEQEDLEEEIGTVAASIGDVQIKDFDSLPTADARFLKTIARVDGTLYQCVQTSGGIYKEWALNVPGTSEVSPTNVSSLYGDIGGNFNDYLDMAYFEKMFRNQGSLKFGSSKYTGEVDLKNKSGVGSITRYRFYVRAYNANVPSSVTFQQDGSEGNTILLTDPNNDYVVELTPIDDYTLNDVLIWNNAEYTTPEEETITCDKRFILTKITATFGEPTFEWQEISTGGGSSIDIRNQVQYLYYVDDPDDPSESYHYVEFPLNIMPLRYKNTAAGIDWIFDYSHSKVVNSNGISQGWLSIDDEGCVFVEKELNNFSTSTSDYLEYIYVNGAGNNSTTVRKLNAYTMMFGASQNDITTAVNNIKPSFNVGCQIITDHPIDWTHRAYLYVNGNKGWLLKEVKFSCTYHNQNYSDCKITYDETNNTYILTGITLSGAIGPYAVVNDSQNSIQFPYAPNDNNDTITNIVVVYTKSLEAYQGEIINNPWN